MSIPTIETERLRLRPHHVEDIEAFHGLWSDPDIVRFIGGVPSTREQTWGRLMHRAGMWHHMGFGFLGMEEKDTGRFIGEVGFHEVHRAITPSIEGTLEAGWVLTPSCHGRGYAYEAMNAMLNWADRHFPEQPMTAIISPENTPSLILAQKLGFREWVRTTYNGDIVIVRRDVRPDASEQSLSRE